MAGTEIRLSCKSVKCDDDSPPVCLVQLNTNRVFSEVTREDPVSPKGTSGASPHSSGFPSYSACESSPEEPRMGNSTPDKALVEGQMYSENAIASGFSITEASDSVEISVDPPSFEPLPTRPETPGAIEIAKSVPNSNDPFDAVTHVEEENSTMTVTEFTPIVAMSDQVKANLSHLDPICPVQPAEDVQPGPSGDSNKLKKQECQDMTEEEDVDLEDRPLTVDVPRESEVVSASPQIVSTSVECEPKQLTDHSREHVPTSPDLDISVSSAGSRMQVPDQSNETKPMKLASLSVRNVPPGSVTMADSLDTAPPLNVTAPVTTSECTLGPKIQEYPVQSKTSEDQPCTVTVVLDQTTSRPHTPSLSSSAKISLNSTVETSDRPSAFPVSTIPFGPTQRPASVHSECDRLSGETTPSVTGLLSIPSASPMPGTAAVVPQPSSLTSVPTLTSPMTLTSQSAVQLMPFVATTTMLNSLTPDPTAPGASTIPQPGTATNGPSSLQIFNMTPMPQFVGAPGIVLHATGPVPGNPGFPGSNQLLAGLPTVGNTHGLGGTTTFNFLQPHQPFSTTLLPQATHGADYLFDLGLSQTPFPPSSNSITLFNSVESIGAGPLSHTATIYPVIQPPGPGPQPHSQSLFPTSCALNASISGPLFVSPPSYRPSMGGVTNLVSSTTPQMATSLGSGSGSFGPANLSSLGGSAAHGGFLFQTTNSHPQPSTQLIPPCGPLIQSAQFSSYPMAFQGADSCLPVAPALTSTLPGFRHSEPQMETSVSSANMNSTPGLPQLWASSTPVSSFSPIPICPSSLPQPTTFPITVNANSAVLAPVVATVATPLSSSSPTAATSTILPHPPALQPCPALTKRFQRLCPLPSGRTPASVGPGLFFSSPTKRNPGLALRPPGSSTTLTTSAVYGNEKRTVPSGFSTAIRSRQPIGPLTANKASIASASLAGLSSASSNPLGATMTIRTPNSVTVIPAARRRRPLARATPSLKAADKTVNQQSVEVSCITPTISTNCIQSTTTPITTTTTTTIAGTTTTTKTTASTMTCVSASPPLITSDTPTAAESVPSDTTQGTDGKLKQTNPLVAGVSDSVSSGTQSQAIPSSMKPVSSVSQLPITVNTSVASDNNLLKSVSNPTSNDTRSRSAVPDRTAVPVSGPTQALEPQNTNLTEKSESHARSSVNTNHNPHLEADTLQSNVLCIPTLPQNKTTPNSPTTNLSPPQNRSRRYSGSRSIVKQTSQRAEPSSVSPGHLSFSPKGTPHTDSFELQASLERLGVSGNQTRKMSTPSATVTTTTVRTTRSHQSSLRTTGQLTVVHTSPVKMMPTALPAPLLPPPLLHRGPDDRRILTHFIDGHVIYESNKPFPVKHGMSVVEAALLHQCITEEQEENDAMRYSVNTTDGLHRPRRSSSSSSGVAFDAPVPSPVNGEQPMQLDDEFSQTDRVADEEESNLCAVQPAPKRLSYASLPEHESPQYKLSSGHSTPHNGYPIQQSGHSLRGSKDTVSTSVESHAELSNHFADRSDQDTASRVKSPISGGSDLPTTTITTAGSTTSSALASGQCPTQRSQQSIYTRMPPAACTSHRPHEACSDMQPTLTARSPVLSVSQTSSPAQTPYTIQHGVQSVGPTSHQFPGLFTYPHPHPVPQLPEPPPPGPVRFWSADDVVTFVRGTPGCGAYAEAFHANEIDGEALLLLAEDQFIQPPIGMKIGPALKLAARLETLRNTS